MKKNQIYPTDLVVERTFAWLTQCRRFCRGYEVLPASSEAMMYLAMTRLMVRRLAACPFSDSFLAGWSRLKARLLFL